MENNNIDVVLENFRVRPASVYKPIKLGKISIQNEIGKESSLKLLKEFNMNNNKNNNESTREVDVTKNDKGK